MIRVSCRAGLVLRKLLDTKEEDAAIETVKARMKAAAMQIALDLQRDGYRVDLDVAYLVAFEEGE
jgi:hypothetical protein